jgi:hypothetical protein
MPTFKNSNPIVERRYSDFLWLHSRLEAQYKGYIIPPLPEKNSLSFSMPSSSSSSPSSAVFVLLLPRTNRLLSKPMPLYH